MMNVLLGLRGDPSRVTEEHEAQKVQELRHSFPLLAADVIRDVLGRHSWDVEKAIEPLFLLCNQSPPASPTEDLLGSLLKILPKDLIQEALEIHHSSQEETAAFLTRAIGACSGPSESWTCGEVRTWLDALTLHDAAEQCATFQVDGAQLSKMDITQLFSRGVAFPQCKRIVAGVRVRRAVYDNHAWGVLHIAARERLQAETERNETLARLQRMLEVNDAVVVDAASDAPAASAAGTAERASVDASASPAAVVEKTNGNASVGGPPDASRSPESGSACGSSVIEPTAVSAVAAAVATAAAEVAAPSVVAACGQAASSRASTSVAAPPGDGDAAPSSEVGVERAPTPLSPLSPRNSTPWVRVVVGGASSSVVAPAGGHSGPAAPAEDSSPGLGAAAAAAAAAGVGRKDEAAEATTAEAAAAPGAAAADESRRLSSTVAATPPIAIASAAVEGVSWVSPSDDTGFVDVTVHATHGSVGTDAASSGGGGGRVGGDAAAFELAACAERVDIGDAVTVSWRAASAAAVTTNDWVAMYADGASGKNYITYQWTRTGLLTGTVSFAVPATAGRYYFVYYGGKDTVRATSGPLDVGPVFTLTTTATPGTTDVAVAVTQTFGRPRPDAWVGLYPRVAVPLAHKLYQTYAWCPTVPLTVMLNARTTGAFEVRLFAQRSYDSVAATAAVDVLGTDSLSLAVEDGYAVVRFDVVTVEPWGSSAWIGVFFANQSDNRNYRRCKSLWASGRTGVIYFKIPQHAGVYEARLLAHNDYQHVLATSKTIEVADGGVLVTAARGEATESAVPRTDSGAVESDDEDGSAVAAPVSAGGVASEAAPSSNSPSSVAPAAAAEAMVASSASPIAGSGGDGGPAAGVADAAAAAAAAARNAPFLTLEMVKAALSIPPPQSEVTAQPVATEPAVSDTATTAAVATPSTPTPPPLSHAIAEAVATDMAPVGMPPTSAATPGGAAAAAGSSASVRTSVQTATAGPPPGPATTIDAHGRTRAEPPASAIPAVRVDASFIHVGHGGSDAGRMSGSPQSRQRDSLDVLPSPRRVALSAAFPQDGAAMSALHELSLARAREEAQRREKEELRRNLAVEKAYLQDMREKMKTKQRQVQALWASYPPEHHSQWTSTVTQYTAGGRTACTYIAATCALQFVREGMLPRAGVWEGQVIAGVAAYNLGPRECADLETALPLVTRVLGQPPRDAKRARVAANWGHFLFDVKRGFPRDLISAFYPDITVIKGKADLRAAVEPRVSAIPGRVALVITGHNETYCLLRTETGRVFFADSHVETQHEFRDVATFFLWLESNDALLEPGDQIGSEGPFDPSDRMFVHLVEHNQVAVHLIVADSSV